MNDKSINPLSSHDTNHARTEEKGPKIGYIGRWTWRWSCLLGLSGLGLVSCVTSRLPQAVIDSGDPIRFHTWEDYYERGRRRILADRIPDAREDFEVCLGIRKGARRKNTVDDWRVRTHGMHMFNGYFPNRELGICYYLQGNLAKAHHYLFLSMSQTPSSRAAFFINKIQADQVAAIYVARPQIQLATHNIVWTSSEAFEVKGTASGAGKISHITIQDQPVLVELADETIPFTKTILLSAGENRIYIEAEDLKGQRVTEELMVIADWQGPQLSIQQVDQATDGWDVHLVCADNSGLEHLSYNQRPLTLDTNAQPAMFSLKITKGLDASFKAMDLAGNKLEVDLRTLLSFSPSDDDLQEAADGIEVVSTLRGIERTEERPSIVIQHKKPIYVVHTDRFFIDGKVQSTNGLASLTLNGEDLLLTGGGDAREIRFSSFFTLCEGTNVLHLVAADTIGNARTNVLTVIHTPPAYVRKEYRLAASVPPLYASRNQSDGYAWQVKIAEALLAPKNQRFNLLTKDPNDLAGIVREFELQLANLVDPRAHIDYRKLNAADLSFNGLLVHHREGVEIRVHLVDTDSGSRHGYVDVYIDDQDPHANLKLQGLVNKIERHYPVLTGNVLELKGKKAVLNLGKQSGLNAWARFLVIKPGPDGSLDRGEILVDDKQWLELNVIDLSDRTAVGAVLPRGGIHQIAEGDYVYAR